MVTKWGWSRFRTAVIVPSAVAVYPVDVVPTTIRLVVGSPPSNASASYFIMSFAADAVTVAATSVSINSIFADVAAAELSSEYPQPTISAAIVADGLICSMVLIAVPVVTGTNAAVVGIAPLPIIYCATL